jgi:hypothetical protein
VTKSKQNVVELLLRVIEQTESEAIADNCLAHIKGLLREKD